MPFRFGLFEFDQAAVELRKAGRLVPLEPQPARALAVLLGRAGQVVTRDELKEAIWGRETHVDFDRGLADRLSEIRFALGDSADNPRFVETLPRRGYRFIAPVREAAGDVSSAVVPPDAHVPSPPAAATTETPVNRRYGRWVFVRAAAAIVVLGAAIIGIKAVLQRDGAAAPARVIIAVSIFDNETGLAEHDRLVSGLSDLVLTRLTTLAPDRLGIVGNAAVLRQPRNIRNLRAVADAVKADYVILGQLQLADPGLRFITHFIRLSDLTHLKANRIPMPDGDVSGLEAAVIAEFERAVREHVIGRSGGSTE